MSDTALWTADPVEPALAFDGSLDLSALVRQLGSGFFRDGFLRLFSSGLADLQPCLEPWSFLLPGDRQYVVVGANAHGALVLLDSPGGAEPVFGVLDPTLLWYWRHPRAESFRLLLYLREERLPFFFEATGYQAWRAASGERLGANQVLGLVTPRPLGGTLALDNLRVEDAVAHHRRLAALYREAFPEAPPARG